MKSLTLLTSQLVVIQRFLDKADIPTQQVLTFLHVAASGEIPMADLVALTNVGQSSVSRNVDLLGKGKPSKPGHGLISAEEDPYFRKRKLVRLTPRGHELRKAIEKIAK